MAFMNDLPLKQVDRINDKIWTKLNRKEQLKLLDPKSFSIKNIEKEIETGCSPCPDIITKDFGAKPSILFVSTVYGLIYKYLNKKYSRDEQHWYEFCNHFYKRIIQSGTGIYSRLDKLYQVMTELTGEKLDYCFTELVKTVLVDEKDNVSGLGSKGSFLQYFENAEYDLLEGRINEIQDKCIIFAFSEEVTYFLLEMFNSSNSFHHLVEIYHTENKEINISRKRNRNGDYKYTITADGTYSNSVAFKTIFKVKDKEIFIVPLPHPSSANNRYWPEACWEELRILLRKFI
jgi:hypothetical protein